MRTLWLSHLNHLSGRSEQLPDRLASELNDQALGRLSRLGAVFPDQLNPGRRKIAAAPLATKETFTCKKQNNDAENPASGELILAVDSICTEKNIKPRYRKIIDARLQRALNPIYQDYAE
jgi:hypothetical protein